MGHFQLRQELRDYAGHPATGGERGVGDGAHQADPAATEHQVQPGFGHAVPQRRGGGPEHRVVAAMGSAEDGDGTDFGHGGS